MFFEKKNQQTMKKHNLKMGKIITGAMALGVQANVCHYCFHLCLGQEIYKTLPYLSFKKNVFEYLYFLRDKKIPFST